MSPRLITISSRTIEAKKMERIDLSETFVPSSGLHLYHRDCLWSAIFHQLGDKGTLEMTVNYWKPALQQKQYAMIREHSQRVGTSFEDCHVYSQLSVEIVIVNRQSFKTQDPEFQIVIRIAANISLIVLWATSVPCRKYFLSKPVHNFLTNEETSITR